ncbi:MAG: helix-turn-helix domain-containing protein, partial [Thermoplasmata archaeon]|nr:helix-turn-helix domain-containing protein [Thermoplasmata archaeon]
MASREILLKEVHELLQKNGFATSNPKDLIHAGFDIVARKDSLILIVKIAANASSINHHAVAGMMTLAQAVDGSSIIIALKAGSDPVEDGVMYTRAGIPLISPQTFYDLIVEGVPPLVYAASGGYYVNVNSEMLRKARQGGMSLGELAEMGGVSRRTIRMYEDGMSAKLEVAIRLEEKMGIELIIPAEPLAPMAEKPIEVEEDVAEGLSRDIFLRLHQIGYSVKQANRCPFDAVTRDKRTILFTGVGQKDSDLARRARIISNLSKILDKHSVIFMEKRG